MCAPCVRVHLFYCFLHTCNGVADTDSLLREQGEARDKRKQEEHARERQALRERVSKETEEAERKAEQDERKRSAVAEYQ